MQTYGRTNNEQIDNHTGIKHTNLSEKFTTEKNNRINIYEL